MVLTVQDCVAFPGMRFALAKLPPEAHSSAIMALTRLIGGLSTVRLIAVHSDVQVAKHSDLNGKLYEIEVDSVHFFIFDYSCGGSRRICITGISVLGKTDATLLAMQ
jgi:hypothetical protein